MRAGTTRGEPGNANRITRRQLVRSAVAAGAGAAIAEFGKVAMLVSGAAKLVGPVNYLGWSGHYELEEVKDFYAETGVKVNFTGGSENADMLTKIKLEGGKQYDVVSADALWVPKFYQEGLIEPIPLRSWPVYNDLFDAFKHLKVWEVGDNMMALPWAWSPFIPWYNVQKVKGALQSMQSFWDPAFRGRIGLQNQPTDIIAYMGVATGAKKPYTMTPAELTMAKEALKRLKPNILKLVGQDDEIVRLMTEESIWLTIGNAGEGYRVQRAGGPRIKSFIPTEGFIGYFDSDMLIKGAAHRDAAIAWLQHKALSKYIAANFLRMGRPLAYKTALDILLKQGKRDLAHEIFYDQPELVDTMTVKGPPPNPGEYIDAFNEAIAG